MYRTGRSNKKMKCGLNSEVTNTLCTKIWQLIDPEKRDKDGESGNDFIELSSKTKELGCSDAKDFPRAWIEKRQGWRVTRSPFSRRKHAVERAKATVVFHRDLRGFLLGLCVYLKRGLNGLTVVEREAAQEGFHPSLRKFSFHVSREALFRKWDPEKRRTNTLSTKIRQMTQSMRQRRRIWKTTWNCHKKTKELGWSDGKSNPRGWLEKA